MKEAKMEHEFRNTIKYLYTFLIHSYTSFDPTNKIFPPHAKYNPYLVHFYLLCLYNYIHLLCRDISKQIQIELHIDNLFQFHIIGFGVKTSSRWLHYNSKYMNLWCMYHYFIHITFLLYHIAKTDIIPKVYIKHQIWCHISIMDKFFSIYFLPITHNKSSTLRK